jgi:TolB protein
MNGLSHKQARRYMLAELDELLDDAQRLDLEAHLDSCPACRAEAQSFSTLTSRLRSEFHERWDAHDGPSQHVTANVRSRTRRIIMSNRVNIGLKALGGVALLVLLGFAVNFVVSQLRGHSVAANGTPDNNMPVNSLDAGDRLLAFTKVEDGNYDVYTIRADGSSLTNLTNDPAYDANPFWSPDGKHIAFESDRNGFMQIFLMDADGSNILQITNDETDHNLPLNIDGKTYPWSPDGSKILFLQSAPEGKAWTLGSINISGKNRTSLATGRISLSGVSWSPDGKYIGYVLNDSPDTASSPPDSIYIVDADGSNLREIKELIPQNESLDIKYYWSFGGQSVIFTATQNNLLQQTVYEFGPGTNTLRQKDTLKATVIDWEDEISFIRDVEKAGLSLVWQSTDGTSNTLDWDAPCWEFNARRSQDGNFAIGAYCPDNKSGFYWANSDGSTIKQLLDPLADDMIGSFGDIAWSPDDQYIAFNIATSEKTNMYILDVEESLKDPSIQPVKVVVGGGDLYLIPSWQPMTNEDVIQVEPSPQAGRRLLAFTMEKNGETDVYTVRADGSDLTNLTGDSNGSNPYWSPDGRRIAFNRNVGDRSQVFLMDADGSNVVQLTDDGDFNKLVAFEEGRDSDFNAWSPDGSKLVFVKLNFERTNDEGWMKLYVLNVGTRTQTPLTSEWGHYQSPAWSPDGKHIAFSTFSRFDEQGEPTRLSVHVVGADGSNPVDLTGSLPDGTFSIFLDWFSDGQAVLFNTYKQSDESAQVYEARLDGSLTELSRPIRANILDWWKGTALTGTPGETTVKWLRPDGTSSSLEVCPQASDTMRGASTRSKAGVLFFGVRCDRGEWRLYLANEDGTRAQKLVDPPLSTGDGVMADQAWSPDGNFIAFNISSGSGDDEMFILDVAATLNDSTLPPVWFNIGEIFSSTNSISWQPVITEETLAERLSQPYEGLVSFTSAVENGNLDIYTMRPDGSGLTNLTKDPAHDVDPYWSPDGKRIAFLSDRAGYMQIFTMNADGSDVFQVTHREADHEFAGADPWSPDGSTLVFIEKTPDGGQLIYTMEANGRNGLPLVYPPENYSSISWSPDGSHIAYIVLSEDTEPQIHVIDTSGNNTVIITDALPAGEVLYSWKYSWTQNGRAISFVAHRHIDEGQDQWVAYEAGVNGDRLVEKATSSTPMHSWEDGTAFIQGFDLSTLTWLRSDGTFSELDLLENCQPASNAQGGFLAQRSAVGSLLIGITCPNNDLWFYRSNPDGTEVNLLPASQVVAPGGLNGIFWSPADRYATLNISASGITSLYVLDVENGSILTTIPIGGGDLFHNISWQPMP